MMKKRILAMALVLTMVLCACGRENGKQENIVAGEAERTPAPSELQSDSGLFVVENVKTMEKAREEKAQNTREKTERETDAAVPQTVAAQRAGIVRALGIGINLGNTLESFWEDKSNVTTGAQTIGSDTPKDYETCWGAAVTTREIIDGMKAAGFQTVRIPVYWGNMMKNDGTFTINERYFARVAEIMDYCLQNRMHVIINIHHYDEFLIKNYPQEKVLEITKTLWSQIATRYRDYGEELIFEGFNENLGSTRAQDSYSEEEIYRYVNAMNQTFVDAVRATGGNNANRFLIASGYWTNIDKTTDARFLMPTDTVSGRLMVSVHYVDNAYYWTNQIGTQEWYRYAKEQCELLQKKFTDNGIPVVLGECTGVYDASHFAWNAVYREDAGCLELILNLLTDYGFVPIIWDDTNHLYDRGSCKITSAASQAVIRQTADKISQ